MTEFIKPILNESSETKNSKFVFLECGNPVFLVKEYHHYVV